MYKRIVTGLGLARGHIHTVIKLQALLLFGGEFANVRSGKNRETVVPYPRVLRDIFHLRIAWRLWRLRDCSSGVPHRRRHLCNRELLMPARKAA